MDPEVSKLQGPYKNKLMKKVYPNVFYLETQNSKDKEKIQPVIPEHKTWLNHLQAIWNEYQLQP